MTKKYFSDPDLKDKLIIIGGGFAGLRVARFASQKGMYQTLMIDTKDYWEYTPGVPRAIIQPDREKFLVVPHSRNIKSENFLRGQVTEVHADYIIVDEEYQIQYNLLVIASGSRYPSVTGGNVKKRVKKTQPTTGQAGSMKDQFSDSTQRLNSIQLEAEKIKNSKHIVVIGGGAVGVELMGEICTKYPNKMLTIIHAHQLLLNNLSSPEECHKVVKKFFQTQNVNMRLGERVRNAKWENGKYLITTNAAIHNKIEADKVYFCAGYIPNSEFMRKNFDNVLNEKGFIKVDKNFQVEGQTNMYAIGDVISSSEDKTAYAAGEHAKSFISNLKYIKAGQLNKRKAYKPMPSPQPLMAISLGVTRGIFLFKGIIVSTKSMAIKMKSTFEASLCGDFNQDKAILKIDFNKKLRDEVKDSTGKEPASETEEDGNEESIKGVYSALSAMQQQAPEDDDIFH